MSTPLIQAHNVSVAYRRQLVLQDVDCRVEEGAALGVIGESGSGKSTLLRALACLCPLAGGSVRVAGEDWATLPAALRRGRRRQLGFLHQDASASLDPHLRIGASLAEAWRLCAPGAPRAAREAALEEALLGVGLTGAHAARRPHELSAGQCQRVQLARALLARPRALLLDEVTSALDAPATVQVAAKLAAARAAGLALIVVSHDLALVERLCSRLLVLDGGRVVEYGELATVYARPAHAVTARLLDARLPLVPCEARARLAGRPV